MKQVLITGVTGFVGRQVLHFLNDTNLELTIVVRSGKEKQFDKFRNIKRVITTKDLFSESVDWWTEQCQDIDIIVHLAWYTEPLKYQKSPKNLECLIGSLNLAKGAIKAGIKKLVGVGTCFEYDLSAGTITVDTPLKPTTPYSDAKTALYVSLSHILSNLNIEFSWCRLFYLYGEGEDPRRLVPYLHSKLQNDEIAKLTRGNQVRDYLDVYDASKMIVDVILSDKNGAFNICSGIPITVRQLAEKIADEYGKRHLLKFGALPDNPFDPPYILGVSNLYLQNIKR